jgi:type III restriction enzyme
MQFQFDATQPHQLQAIQSVVDVLDGQFSERLYGQDFYSADIVPNVDSYWSWNDDNEEILSSMLTNVRTKNKLNERVTVTFDEGDSLRGLHWHRCPHFTIEMETGTGKTYVYLRTMFELHRAYQLSKFVIVVPSIAIYEGVVKAEQTMRKHLSELYPGVVFSLINFDGDKLSDLRDFATRSTSEINILILTRDSFNKSSNNLYKETYKLMGGKFPINYIAETRPVVILDEPQNMRTERSKEALRELQPLCVLRYSATHKENPNQIFTLTPIEAFNQGLVKRINVIGVEADKNSGQIAEDVSLSLLKIEFKSKAKKKEWQAKFLVNINEKGVLKAKEVTLKQGDDLAKKTKNPLYTGYVIGDEGAIDGTNKSVTFDNQMTLTLSDSDGEIDEVLYREQIRRTIEVHFEKQRQMRPHGVKVLSLFFIDRVKHYTLAQGVVR